jgi:ABC-2 type transport system ATP-binding protein
MDHGRILALDTPAGLKAGVGADTIVTVSADQGIDKLGEAVERRVDGVRHVHVQDGTLRVALAGAGGVLPTILRLAEEVGASVTDLSVNEPTLETVFINLTGKDLRD